MPDHLTVLFRDEHIVVIDKPTGLLVHRSEIDRHETRFAIQILRDQIGQRVWAAHRLDRGTSGVLLFALNKELAGTLGRQFAAGTVEKLYWAVIRWTPGPSIIRCVVNTIRICSPESGAARGRKQP